MKISSSAVLQVAEATGFEANMVEKVFHLLHLLNVLNFHVFLFLQAISIKRSR